MKNENKSGAGRSSRDGRARSGWVVILLLAWCCAASPITSRAACPPETGDWDINIASARIYGRFLLGGNPFPVSFLHGANFFLRNDVTGDEVYLGLSNNQSYDRRVVPGTYRVVYEHKIGDQVPLNAQAVVIKRWVISPGTHRMDIAVPWVQLQGDFQFDGALAPSSPTESGRIRVLDRFNGALTTLGRTSDQHYAARLIPGRYDLLYEALTGSAIAPANPSTVLRRRVPIEESQTLNVNVPTVVLEGNFLVNGISVENLQTERGRIYLFDRETKSRFLVGDTSGGYYQLRIIPAFYDIEYARLAGSVIVPANSLGKAQTGLVLTESAELDINVPAVLVSGAFYFNGVPAPDSAAENARVWLRAGDDEIYLGETRGGNFQIMALPGRYDVVVEYLTGSGLVPANQNGVIGTVQITEESVLEIDIPTVQISGSITLDSDPFPGSTVGHSSQVYLEEVSTGETILLATYPQSSEYSRLVVPGTYRIRYSYLSGSKLPRNIDAVLGDAFELIETSTKAINIRSTPLEGSFTLNGAAWPAQPGQNAAITLRQIPEGGSVFIGSTGAGDYSTRIIPGYYTATYNWAQGNLIPRNQNAEVDCALVMKDLELGDGPPDGPP